jgi:hypothetical protein
MCATDADFFGCAVFERYFDIAVFGQREVVLADLVVFGEVRVVVAFAVPLCKVGIDAVERQTRQHGIFDGGLVHYRRTPGIPMQIGQTRVLAGSPKASSQPQNILVLVAS